MASKKLYRINPALYEIESHEIGEDCLPHLVERYPNYGDLYRCKNKRHDHYGYFKRSEARLEAIQLIKQEINRLTHSLIHLTIQQKKIKPAPFEGAGTTENSRQASSSEED